MAMVTCRECKHKISSKAGACPSCGAPQKPKRDAISSLARIFLIVFIGVPVLIGVGASIFSEGETPKTAEERAERAKQAKNSQLMVFACSEAQRAVKQRLKAPSSAKFPGCGLSLAEYEIRATADKATWWVEGYVDSQNSYGAMLRREFIVKLTLDGDNWTPVDVALNE